jgi:hypothetical protein
MTLILVGVVMLLQAGVNVVFLVLHRWIRHRVEELEINSRAAPEMAEALRRIVMNPQARIGGDIRAEAIAALKKAGVL